MVFVCVRALLTLSSSLCCSNSGQRPKPEDLEDNQSFCRRCEHSLWRLHLLLHLRLRHATALRTSTPSRFHTHVLHDPQPRRLKFKAGPNLVSSNQYLILGLVLNVTYRFSVSDSFFFYPDAKLANFLNKKKKMA